MNSSALSLFHLINTTKINREILSSFVVQPPLYYKEKNGVDGVEIFGRICIFIQYMIILPIFALFFHILFKFIRKTLGERIDPEINEIVESVHLPPLGNSHSKNTHKY